MNDDKVTFLTPNTIPASYTREVVVPTIVASVAMGASTLLSIWAGTKIAGWLGKDAWNRFSEFTELSK